MKLFKDMWKDLSPYLTCEKGLDQGYANGKYTREFAKYCKHVVGIDLSEDFYKQAKENLKDLDNVELKIMDALKVDYPDKYFDVIFNTSFHEFDLKDFNEFKIDYELKTKILKEMVRLTDTIVFSECAPENISGKLFQVFYPIEDHSKRIEISNEIIDKVLKEEGYKLILCDRAVDEITFKSRREFEEEMIDWWSNVRIPSNEKDKQEMINKIDAILETEHMLSDLTFHDVFRYTVYKK